MADTIILSSKIKDYAADIDKLTQSLDGLEKESKDYQNVVNEIKGKQEQLNNILSDSTETTEKVNEATVSLKAQFKELQKQMQQMLAEGISPTDEAFVEIAKKAGDMKDAMADASAVIRHYADDTRGLSTVVDIAKTGAAVYGTYTGVLKTFGIENESVNNSLQTLMGIMTTLNSLQQLQTALVDRASITYRAYHGVVELLTKAKIALGTSTNSGTTSMAANTTAVGANTAAMVADTAATTAATVATNLFKKALMATGIGLVVVAIGTLVSYLDDLWDTIKFGVKWIGKLTGLIKEETAADKAAAMAAKLHAQNIDELKQKEKDLAEETAKTQANFESLKTIWDSLSSVQQKTKFIKQYANELRSLGLEIKNVNDAEKLFSVNGTAAFAKSLELRAQLVLKQQKLLQLVRKENELVEKNAMGDAIWRVQEEKRVILREIEDLARQIDKYQPVIRFETETPKTTKKSTNIDISGEMTELQKSLKEQIDAMNFYYDMLEVKGKKTLNDELDRISGLYVIETDIYEKEIEDRQKQLENTKITAEQRKQIEKELYEYQYHMTELKREYELQTEELRIQGVKEANAEIRRITKKSLEEEKQIYANNNIADFYVELLKDTEPEIAVQLLKTFGLSDELNEKIINGLDQINSTNADIQKEYWLQQEEEEHQHQLNLIEIQKQGLEEIGILQGQESDEYVEEAKRIDAEVESEKKRHAKALAKIEKDHAKNSKKENKATLNDYLGMANSIGSIFDSVAGIMEDDIKAKQENGEITEEEAKKQFETVKSLQIVAATIDMLSGAVQAYSTAQQLGPIAGPIIGGINAAAVVAMGMMNINQIKQQQWGGQGGASNASVPSQRDVTSIDFSGVQVNPLLDETADLNRMTTLSEQQTSTQQVVILQSDIEDSMKQVQIRETNTKF